MEPRGKLQFLTLRSWEEGPRGAGSVGHAAISGTDGWILGSLETLQTGINCLLLGEAPLLPWSSETQEAKSEAESKHGGLSSCFPSSFPASSGTPCQKRKNRVNSHNRNLVTESQPSPTQLNRQGWVCCLETLRVTTGTSTSCSRTLKIQEPHQEFPHNT